MKRLYKIAFAVLILVGIALAGLVSWKSNDMAVMHPKGLVAMKQRAIIVQSTLLMFIVVIPVFFLTVYIAWKYRAGNKKAKYDPEWDYSFAAEALWWGIPFAIIVVLSIITWKSSHDLDPYKPLETEAKPLRIQAVALQWKWLFLYPEQKIASVNFLQFPEKTPLNFEITADAPMNSFWIPQLGGQIYAMPGMKTKLHLIASEVGDYRGSSANLSGTGFAGMWFIARASTPAEFDQWVESARASPSALNFEDYAELAKPSANAPVTTYSLPDETLYDRIVMKFTMPKDPDGQ